MAAPRGVMQLPSLTSLHRGRARSSGQIFRFELGDNTSRMQAAADTNMEAILTLAVDVGGTKLKVCTVDGLGHLRAEPWITSTPKPATPEALVLAIVEGAERMGPFQRVSVGFPGVVRGSTIYTAPNLGNQIWHGVDLGAALEARLGRPVRILNDAAVQGLGVVEGPGVESVVTLGTGVGCAVYRDRNWLLHLELGLDDVIGNAVLGQLGTEAWNKRVLKALADVRQLTSSERVYVGGGNARKLALPLPPYATLVSNAAGLTGGVRLWERALDPIFEASSGSGKSP